MLVELLKLLRPNSAKQKGFAIPLVIVIGLVMFVSSMMVIVRAMGQKTDQVMKEKSSQALSMAELGVTRYQNLLLENPELAIYPDCAGVRNSSGDCPDSGSTMSWSNVTAIPNAPSDSAQINKIQKYTNGDWINVVDGKPEKGQIKLLSFNFDNSKNEGTLVLEGRVDQSSQGEEMAGTGISRLRVAFEITPDPSGGGSSTSPPEIWINDNNDSVIGSPGGSTGGGSSGGSSGSTGSSTGGSTAGGSSGGGSTGSSGGGSTGSSGGARQIMASIRDSTPVAVSNPAVVASFKARQQTTTPPYTYEENSTTPLPTPPTEGEISNLPTDHCEVAGTVTNTITMPVMCAKDGSIYTIWSFINPNSFALEADKTFTVDSPGDTVTFYVEGTFDVDGTIKVTPGTKLVIYAHGPVDIGGTLEAGDDPGSIQIYSYSTDPITISPTSEAVINAKGKVRFAPSGSGPVDFKGMVVAPSVEIPDEVGIDGASIPCDQLPAAFCGPGGKNQLGSIVSWEKISR